MSTDDKLMPRFLEALSTLSFAPVECEFPSLTVTGMVHSSREMKREHIVLCERDQSHVITNSDDRIRVSFGVTNYVAVTQTSLLARVNRKKSSFSLSKISIVTFFETTTTKVNKKEEETSDQEESRCCQARSQSNTLQTIHHFDLKRGQ